MKTLKKHWKWVALAAVIVLLIAIFTTWRPVKNPATQEYIVGSGNCRGQVDTARFLAVDDAFAIGADEASTAVTLWRDGAAVGSFTVGTLTRTFASSSLVVGGGAAFAGFIDEIRISPRVLDAEEMLRHYRMGIVIRVR